MRSCQALTPQQKGWGKGGGGAYYVKGYCLRECMVYEAKLLAENNFKLHYRTCEGEFKSRFYNHTKPLRDRGNETGLSNYI